MNLDRSWTILLYMAGDNGRVFDSPVGKKSLMAEMTGAGHSDIAEAQQVGTTDDVAILAQFDTLGEDDRTVRLEIGKGGTTEEHVVETISETNCGDPATLTDFIVWGMQRCPAQRTMLVIWNHGFGWKDDDIYAEVRAASRAARPAVGTRSRPVFRSTAQAVLAIDDEAQRGIAADDTSMDFLTTEELKRAIADARTKTGQKLDIIGMDACLMAMLEVQYQLRDLTDYMVASQEVEPMAGWPYTQILGRLAAEPAMVPADLSRLVVDEYVKSYGGASRAIDDVTQSAVALAGMGDAADRLRAFVQAATGAGDRTSRWALLDAKQSALSFRDPEYLDLGDFLDRFVGAHPNPEATVVQSAQALRETLEPGAGVVLANETGGHRFKDRAHGVSIYFPIREQSQFYDGLDFASYGWPELVRLVNGV